MAMATNEVDVGLLKFLTPKERAELDALQIGRAHV